MIVRTTFLVCLVAMGVAEDSEFGADSDGFDDEKTFGDDSDGEHSTIAARTAAATMLIRFCTQ